jgi:hypothetical protein
MQQFAYWENMVFLSEQEYYGIFVERNKLKQDDRQLRQEWQVV